MFRTALVALAVGLLAGTLGFFAGERSAWEQYAPPPAVRPDASPPQSETEVRIREVLLERDPIRRIERLASLLQELAPDAAPLVERAFEPTTLDSGAVELTLVATWWADFDPQSALRWASRDLYRGDANATAAVIQAWARRDPEAARAAVEAMPLPNVSLPAVDALIRGWDESGQPGLLDFVRAQPRGQAMQMTLASLARRKLLRLGPEATLEWAESFPDDDDPTVTFKLNVFRRAAGMVAEVDPERAAVFALKHREGAHGHGLVRRVAVRWARQDGQAALEWLGTLGPGTDRENAVDDGYRAWFNHDREGAIQWLKEQPNGPWLGPAHSIYALHLGTDPEPGMDWARAHILDEEKREYAINQIGRGWYYRDPEGAREWLESRPERIQELIKKQTREAKASEQRQKELRAEMARKQREAR
jgi:hypothetical protein